MNHFQTIGSTLGLVTLTSLGLVASMFTKPTIVHAQAAYNGYIGLGAANGFVNGGSGEETGVSAVIVGRQRIANTPLSLRGQVFLFSGTTSFVPTISYDAALGPQADVYLGVGASLTDGNQPSPVGNRNAVVLQPGLDVALPNSNLVLFINGVVAFSAFKNSENTAVSVQGGLGAQF